MFMTTTLIFSLLISKNTKLIFSFRWISLMLYPVISTDVTEQIISQYSVSAVWLHEGWIPKEARTWAEEHKTSSSPSTYSMFQVFFKVYSLTPGNQLYQPGWEPVSLLPTLFQLKCLRLPLMGFSSFYGVLCSPARCPFHTQLPPQLHFRLINRTLKFSLC